MLAIDAMSDEERAARYNGEDDPIDASDEDRAYWVAIVQRDRQT